MPMLFRNLVYCNQRNSSSSACPLLLEKLVIFATLLLCLLFVVHLSPIGLRLVAGQVQGDYTPVSESDQGEVGDQDDDNEWDSFFNLPKKEQRRFLLDERAKSWHTLDFTNPQEQVLKITILPVAGNFVVNDLIAFVKKPIACTDKEILGRLKIGGYGYGKFSGMTCYVDTSDGIVSGMGAAGTQTVVAYVSIETNLRKVDITMGVFGFHVGKSTGDSFETLFFSYYLSRVIDDVVFKETGKHLTKKYLDHLSGLYEIEEQKKMYEGKAGARAVQ